MLYARKKKKKKEEEASGSFDPKIYLAHDCFAVKQHFYLRYAPLYIWFLGTYFQYIRFTAFHLRQEYQCNQTISNEKHTLSRYRYRFLSLASICSSETSKPKRQLVMELLLFFMKLKKLETFKPFNSQ